MAAVHRLPGTGVPLSTARQAGRLRFAVYVAGAFASRDGSRVCSAPLLLRMLRLAAPCGY